MVIFGKTWSYAARFRAIWFDSVFNNSKMSLPYRIQPRKPNPRPTECAVLTGLGRSAIAVIGLRGDRSGKIIDQCFRKASEPVMLPGQIRYGIWTGPRDDRPDGDDPSIGEAVVVTPIEVDHLEIHCHGGAAAIERIVGDLRRFGASQIEMADWLGTEPALIAEALQVLQRCLTARTAAIALDQVRGALLDWVTNWIAALESKPLASAVDAASDDGSLKRLRQTASEILAQAPIGTRLTQPFRVVLIGPPNVGKSSLINAIVGYDRSITHRQAGTTRDVLEADTVIDGLPIRLSDTAGIRQSDQPIEREGISRAWSAAQQADLILSVTSAEPQALAPGLEPRLAPGLEPRLAPGFGPPLAPGLEPGLAPDLWPPLASGLQPPTVASQLAADVSARGVAVCRVINKSDLRQPGDRPPSASIATNALTGEGIPELLAVIAEKLGQSTPPPGHPVPVTGRQADLVGKIVRSTSRQQSLRLLRELLGGNHGTG